MTKPKMDLPPELEGVPVEEALECIDGPPEFAPPDSVPHVAQEVPVASYRDWRKEDTRIVTCRIGNDLYPGQRYESREEAKVATEMVHGRILEANYLPGRAFFRVMKTPRVS
jgi:hypothetical protein